MSENPMFLRQRLRDRLKRARESAGMTQQQVAEAFAWSPSKVIRLENGKIGVNITDAMALVQHYGIAEDEAAQLIDLAKAARQPSWYAPYRSVMSSELEAYISYEESASIVRNYERNVVPGLLQTEEYARSIQKEVWSGSDLDMSVELRMRRQRALESTEAEFFFILDESVLRRTIGNETIMQQQLDALLRFNDYPNVQIQYVPFSKGMYPLFRTPYQIFEFSGGTDDLVAYLENPEGDVLLSEAMPKYGSRRTPADYLDAFWDVERNVAEDIRDGVTVAA
ncbi:MULTISPECIES: helix-turn-helix domain-containing protein [unclassified Streptomyces]|uniref:helix-turn-helix domain-containing protein n=1 Tax=unclassified Streptomyces TaxID=2593676 RepID=UPI002E78E2EA|nr:MULTISPECIES: helix-turn-helix transcriptional regulator [unclassified Streptomyces]MEE1761799.1 helix-turn-helix transcriptional regulator [Streptomyces sp. SP18BB07]MEE1835297.1 helix-turn-helix transcriptional regulator [Streptomyces sp. SP17KL33]